MTEILYLFIKRGQTLFIYKKKNNILKDKILFLMTSSQPKSFYIEYKINKIISYI